MTCIRGIPPTPPVSPVPTRQEGVKRSRWRRHQLMVAGLDELTAHRLASSTDVDLHAVLSLHDTGATMPAPGDVSASADAESPGTPHV